MRHLIIVCERAARECPKLFPGAARQYSWPFPDPVGVDGPVEKQVAAFRSVRDGIEHRILEWLRDPDVGLVGGRK